MADPDPTPGDVAAEPKPPLEGQGDAAALLSDVGSAAALERSARHATLGLATYTIVALGLIGWSLRRGRLSDTLLLLAAMAVTLPPILSYRRQLRKRLRTLAGGSATGDQGTSGEPAGDTTAAVADADESEGAAPTPPSEA